MPTNKPTIASVLNQEDYELLLAYCEEMGLSQSKAVATILAKVFNLLYEDGKRVNNLDGLTTADKMIQKTTELASVDSESLEFLLRHTIASMREIKQQNQNSLNALQDSVKYMQFYEKVLQHNLQTSEQQKHSMRNLINKELNSFRSLIRQDLNSFRSLIRQDLNNFQNQIVNRLNSILKSIEQSLARLSKVLRI